MQIWILFLLTINKLTLCLLQSKANFWCTICKAHSKFPGLFLSNRTLLFPLYRTIHVYLGTSVRYMLTSHSSNCLRRFSLISYNSSLRLPVFPLPLSLPFHHLLLLLLLLLLKLLKLLLLLLLLLLLGMHL